MTDLRELKKLASKLGFRAIEANWHEYSEHEWLEKLLREEEAEREKRSLERRIKEANIGQFKPMSEFDWTWPKKIDRERIEELFSLDFLRNKENVVLVATNGLGKTMISQNLAYKALLSGHKTRFVKASKMLDELLQCESAAARRRRIKSLCRIDVLAVDEVGYMSYDNRYADLLYEVISERYQNNSTIITTNKAFTDWGEIFPNAACVVTMVDRLTHKAELIAIEGESYRHHEAELLAQAKAEARKAKSAAKKRKKEE
jgi:DNA replication protein DnaC